MNDFSFYGVGVAGKSWSLHAAATAAATGHPAPAAHAIMRRNRRAAATAASVNRGIT